MLIQQQGPASGGKLAVMLIGLAVAIVGCHKVTGGGWLAGVNGGKATFGFQGQCKVGTSELDFGGGPVIVPELAFYEGQFQYHDKGARVSFHGDIVPDNSVLGFPGTCDELVAEMVANEIATNETSFSGECVSRPGDVAGTFKVTVVDNGKAGPGAGDEITVTTPNYFVQPIFDDEWNVIGEQVVPIGLPCTADGQAYSNSGLVGGGNIVMPGHDPG